jgi:hypothetical protein
MRKLATLIAVAVLAVALLIPGLSLGCERISVTGSGNLTTETHDLTGFTRVEAQSGFQIEVTQSSTFSIEITADDNIHEFIEVQKSGETLSIRLRGNRFYHSVTLEATVTMPELYKIELSGGSQATITGFSSSHDFEAEMSGGSQLSGDITAADADFELSGGSQVNLEGTGDGLVVDASGGSQLDLEGFSINDAYIEISGGGRATVNVSGTLDVNLSGGSKVLYVGEPTLGDIQLSGDSTVSEK